MEKGLQFKKTILKIMRISLFQAVLAMVFCTIAQAHETHAQEVLERKISVQLKNQGVESVLKRIEKVSDVQFMYNHQIFGANEQLSLSVNNERLDKVLAKVFAPMMIDYEVVGKHIILRKSIKAIEKKDIAITTEIAMQETVSGKVIDEKGDPVPGVSIVVKDTQKGTTTDASGLYKLTYSDDNTVLIFSSVGYEKQEVTIGKRILINITLKGTNQSLDEVVVVGYGTAKKATLAGSVATVSALNSFNPNDIDNISFLKDGSAAIYGSRAAGGVVLITTKRGKPGNVIIKYNG